MKRCFAILLLLLSLPASAETYTMQLHRVKFPDLLRVVYGDVLHRSFIIEDEVLQSEDMLSINWIKLGKAELDKMTRQALDRRGFDIIDAAHQVLTVRRRPGEDDDLLIYTPRYRATQYLSDILAKVADVQPLGARSMAAPEGFQQSMSTGQQEKPGAASVQFNRFAIDQLAYSCMQAKCTRLRKLLTDLDTPEAQVVLRAAVYEVGTNKGEGSAVQLAAKLLQGRLVFSAGTIQAGNAQVQITSGGLDAVLSVLDNDGRFKSISKPLLRVKSGAQARFSVGQQVPVLGGIAQDKNGNSVQSVEYRQSGTIFTVQPDIREAVVDLNISQELSSFVVTTTGVNNSPTLLQRTASSQLTIAPGEVAVFAGLAEQREDESDSSLFGFRLNRRASDISSEVLLFIEAQRL